MTIVRPVDPPVAVRVRCRYPGHDDVGLPGLVTQWTGLVEFGTRVWLARVTVDPDDVPPGVIPPARSVPARDVILEADLIAGDS